MLATIWRSKMPSFARSKSGIDDFAAPAGVELTAPASAIRTT
jgi:hypothetical protein